MDTNVFIDAIALIVKEQAYHSDTNSDDLIKRIIDMTNNPENKYYMGGDALAKELIGIIEDLLDYKSDGLSIDIANTARRTVLAIIDKSTDEEEKENAMIGMIRETILPSTDRDTLYKSILEHRRILYSFYVERKVKGVLRKATAKINRLRNASNIKNHLLELQEEIGKITDADVTADEAILNEISLDSNNLSGVIEELEKKVSKRIYSIGMSIINTMLQGGVRAGECILINALSHNFKTGLTATLFTGFCVDNQFEKNDLALWISLEDDLGNILEFIYRLLIISKTGDIADMTNVSQREVIEYVEKEIQSKGINVKFIRVDPTLWSYKDLFNKVEQYIARGYNIKIVAVDYLDKLPSTGLDTTGPIGSDRRSLVRKVRNFMYARDIVFITPWQLSASANELLKAGMNQAQFAEHVALHGYTAGNSTLHTDADLVLVTHKIKIDGDYFLNVARGKHKVPSIIKDELKKAFFKFPDDGPIPLDCYGVTGPMGNTIEDVQAMMASIIVNRVP